MRGAPSILVAVVVSAAIAACSTRSTSSAQASSSGSSSSAGSGSSSGGGADAGADGGAMCTATVDLPVIQTPDETAAARGALQFTTDVIGQGIVPLAAVEDLWIVWGTGPLTGADFWTAFRARYGFYDAPFDNGGLPMGVRQSDGNVTFDCLTCHATVTAGVTLLGVGNSQLDLQGLFDDLVQLRQEAQSYGYDVPPLPYTLTGRTGAAGANDAMGIGMYLTTQIDPPPSGTTVHTTAGFQQAPAWWSLRYRNRMYLDGSGQAGGYRTMMATLLASGATPASLEAEDATFADIYQYLLSLEPPCWPFGAIDEAARGRGQTVFEATCAGCHGVMTGAQASFPEMVVPAATVGTDPVRAASFTSSDASYVDATWVGGDGSAPYAMTATGGYLAPPLVGVWATAPYFHNGSVPDLASVLDSTQRPTRWLRTGFGASDYDATRVGWKTTTVATSPGTATIEARRTYDTTQPGLSNAGHTYGDALSASDRADLLEYLKSL